MMKRIYSIFLLGALAVGLSASPALADNNHYRGHDRRSDRHHNYSHRNNHRDYVRVDGRYGYWYQGRHGNRNGWWFVSDNRWYAYPRPVTRTVVVYQQPQIIYRTAAPQIVTVPPAPRYADNDSEYCREFQSTIIIDNQPQPAYGTACQQPDNSWKFIH